MLADLLDIQYLISIITKTIDFFVVLIIGISATQTILPAARYMLKLDKKTKYNNNIAIRNFVKGLLLALELESANAILKMGMFTLNITNVDSHMPQNTDDFVFFVAVLSVRIAINQSLRRFKW